MKNNLILMLCFICTVALPLTSCNTFGDERVAATKTYLENRINNESQGAFTFASFTKTNGTEQDFGGMKAYELEFTCSVRTEKDCWKIGNGVEGFFGGFRAYFTYPTYDQLMNLYEARQFKQGSITTLKGKASLVKKDNGWAVEEMKVY